MRNIRLGELIAKLEQRDPADDICFDFCDLIPSGLSSYRGDYSELAIEYKTSADFQALGVPTPTVGEFLHQLQMALQEPFDGYKGGTYRMSVTTPVWVDNWGHCTGTKIVGVAQQYSTVYLITEKDLT